MTKPKIFRLGMIGCGDISNHHALAAKGITDKLKITACCDINELAAKNWAKKYGCDRWYLSYEEMIRTENLDGVLLATWPNQHREQVEKCLKAGAKNILCEKALTLTGQQAYELWKLVKENDAFLMEGFMYRHHPLMREIEKIVKSDQAGLVDNVRACFSGYDNEDDPADDPKLNWRRRNECAGGVPYDLASYCVSGCNLYNNGLPTKVLSTGGLSEKYGTINRLYSIIQYDNGGVSFIESSKKSSFTQELQISCAGMILNTPVAWTPNENDGIIIKRNVLKSGRYGDERLTIKAANAYQLQMINFVDATNGQAKPAVPLIESVINSYTLEAIVKSLIENRLVNIELPNEICQAYKEFRSTR
jgi:predicted dehydrogenase